MIRNLFMRLPVTAALFCLCLVVWAAGPARHKTTVPQILAGYILPAWVGATGVTFTPEHYSSFAADGIYSRWLNPHTADTFPTTRYLQDAVSAAGASSTALGSGSSEYQAWITDGTTGPSLVGASLAGTMSGTTNTGWTAIPSSFVIANGTGNANYRQTPSMAVSLMGFPGGVLTLSANPFSSADNTGRDYLAAPAITATGTGTLTGYTVNLSQYYNNATQVGGVVLQTSQSNLPVGSGLGSFGSLYRPPVVSTPNQMVATANLFHQSTDVLGLSLRWQASSTVGGVTHQNTHIELQVSQTLMRIWVLGDYRTGGNPASAGNAGTYTFDAPLTIGHWYVPLMAVVGSPAVVYASLYDATTGTYVSQTGLSSATNPMTFTIPTTGTGTFAANQDMQGPGVPGFTPGFSTLVEAETWTAPQITPSPSSVALTQTGVTVNLTAFGVSWTNASTSQFSVVSGVTGTLLTSQVVNTVGTDPTPSTATITLNVGSTGGNLVLTDGTTQFTITLQPIQAPTAAVQGTTISASATPSFTVGSYTAYLFRGTAINGGADTGPDNPAADTTATIINTQNLSGGAVPAPYTDVSAPAGLSVYRWYILDSVGNSGVGTAAYHNLSGASQTVFVGFAGTSKMFGHTAVNGAEYAGTATIPVTNGGSGYHQATTTITVSGGGGFGVTATCQVVGGVVVRAWITNPGFLYETQTSPAIFTVVDSDPSPGTGAVLATESAGGAPLAAKIMLEAEYPDRTFNLVNCGVGGSASGGWMKHGSLVLTGATNASPIMVTTRSAHGLTDGQAVTIIGVLGNTAANGTYFAHVLTSGTFALYASYSGGTFSDPVAGNGAFAPLYGAYCGCAIVPAGNMNYLLENSESTLTALGAAPSSTAWYYVMGVNDGNGSGIDPNLFAEQVRLFIVQARADGWTGPMVLDNEEYWAGGTPQQNRHIQEYNAKLPSIVSLFPSVTYANTPGFGWQVNASPRTMYSDQLHNTDWWYAIRGSFMAHALSSVLGVGGSSGGPGNYPNGKVGMDLRRRVEYASVWSLDGLRLPATGQ